MKFQTARGWRKRSKSDGKVQELMRFAAYRHNFGFGICNAARFKFFPTNTVDNVAFGHFRIGFGHWTNNVCLVIFPRQITGVDINDMISVVQPEHWICTVPVNVVDFSTLSLRNSHNTEDYRQKQEFHLHFFVVGFFIVDNSYGIGYLLREKQNIK